MLKAFGKNNNNNILDYQDDQSQNDISSNRIHNFQKIYENDSQATGIPISHRNRFTKQFQNKFKKIYETLEKSKKDFEFDTQYDYNYTSHTKDFQKKSKGYKSEDRSSRTIKSNSSKIQIDYKKLRQMERLQEEEKKRQKQEQEDYLRRTLEQKQQWEFENRPQPISQTYLQQELSKQKQAQIKRQKLKELANQRLSFASGKAQQFLHDDKEKQLEIYRKQIRQKIEQDKIKKVNQLGLLRYSPQRNRPNYWKNHSSEFFDTLKEDPYLNTTFNQQNDETFNNTQKNKTTKSDFNSTYSSKMNSQHTKSSIGFSQHNTFLQRSQFNNSKQQTISSQQQQQSFLNSKQSFGSKNQQHLKNHQFSQSQYMAPSINTNDHFQQSLYSAFTQTGNSMQFGDKEFTKTYHMAQQHYMRSYLQKQQIEEDLKQQRQFEVESQKIAEHSQNTDRSYQQSSQQKNQQKRQKKVSYDETL